MRKFIAQYEPILVFYALACAFSWPFFWWRDVASESWNALPLHGIVKTSLVMWGPGLSALLCGVIYRKRVVKTTTLFGSSAWRSLAFWLVPMAAFVWFTPRAEDASTSLAIYAGGTFLFTLGEELGWRGFLQDQLRHLPKWKRYLLIGVLWESWHFTTRTLSGSWLARVLRPLLFMVPNSIVSAVFGEAVDRSKSIAVAVTLHTWLNLVFEFGQPSTYVILSLAVPYWAFMLYYWDRRAAR
jgi:membrane protease YdiL (CAAX protease family)